MCDRKQYLAIAAIYSLGHQLSGNQKIIRQCLGLSKREIVSDVVF